jgi:hypothetical protein
MDERMRIAFGGLHTECSTFNPLLMQTDDFRIQRGDALLAQAEFAPLRAFNANFLPTLHARAVPGGPISRTTYESLKTEFLDRLAALANVDGLYLAMHGASFVEGMEDAEGDWITAARRAVGPNMPISVSYDLHGNVSQRIIDAIDMFCGNVVALSANRRAPRRGVGKDAGAATRRAHQHTRRTCARALRRVGRAGGIGRNLGCGADGRLRLGR